MSLTFEIFFFIIEVNITKIVLLNSSAWHLKFLLSIFPLKKTPSPWSCDDKGSGVFLCKWVVLIFILQDQSDNIGCVKSTTGLDGSVVGTTDTALSTGPSPLYSLTNSLPTSAVTSTQSFSLSSSVLS